MVISGILLVKISTYIYIYWGGRRGGGISNRSDIPAVVLLDRFSTTKLTERMHVVFWTRMVASRAVLVVQQ